MIFDAKVIRGMLPPARILEYFEREYAARREHYVTHHCPRCGHRTRACVYVHATSGAWKCFAHGCCGDLFALVAGYSGIEIGRDTFGAVVALAARIAGVDGQLPPEERERLLAEHRRSQIDRAERERARMLAARSRMPGEWASLARRDARGETYLRDSRRVDPAPLHARELLRYTPRGEPAAVLRDLGSGEIVGIQYRRLLPGEPRQLVFRGSQVSGAALVGRVSDFRAESVTVITEGFVDTLTACLAWPEAAVFGAPGAGQLGAVASAVAPRIAARGGVLLVVGDNDDAGRDGVASALAAAARAGLRRVSSVAPREPGTVRSVELGVGLDDRPHRDLNDAWRRSAWQWRWGLRGATDER